MNARSLKLIEEMNSLEAEMEMELNPAIDRLIEAGVLKEKAANAPLDIRQQLAYRDSIYGGMGNKIHELNLAWNIEEGLY